MQNEKVKADSYVFPRSEIYVLNRLGVIGTDLFQNGLIGETGLNLLGVEKTCTRGRGIKSGLGFTGLHGLENGRLLVKQHINHIKIPIFRCATGKHEACDSQVGLAGDHRSKHMAHIP